MRHEAVLSFDYDTARQAERVERSLSPEVGDIDGDRTSVSVSRSAETLEIVVTASDLVALRAGANTWLSLVDVAESAGVGGAGTPRSD